MSSLFTLFVGSINCGSLRHCICSLKEKLISKGPVGRMLCLLSDWCPSSLSMSLKELVLSKCIMWSQTSWSNSQTPIAQINRDIIVFGNGNSLWLSTITCRVRPTLMPNLSTAVAICVANTHLFSILNKCLWLNAVDVIHMPELVCCCSWWSSLMPIWSAIRISSPRF